MTNLHTQNINKFSLQKKHQRVMILNLTQEEAPHVQYKMIPFSFSFFWLLAIIHQQSFS